MTPELVALGRRAVACKGWKYRRGMAVVMNDGERAIIIKANGFTAKLYCEDRGGGVYDYTFSSFLPDLFDPATLGCLLALVREAHDSDCAHAWTPTRSQGRWIVSRPEREGDYPSFNPDGWFSLSVGEHATEAEALVSALENAP